VTLLRILFTSLTSTLVKLAIFAGILLALYLVLLRPLFERTDAAIKTSDRALQRTLGSAGLGQIDQSFESLSSDAQNQLREAFGSTSPNSANRHELIRCIERAPPSADRINRCASRY
jgi:hypothetical protein